jgi:hypothetical protein
LNYAVVNCKSARNAPFNAQWRFAMPAGYGKTDAVSLLYVNLGVYLYTLKRPSHVAFAGRRKRAVIFAQMASQTPFFVYIYPFHRLLPQKKAPRTTARNAFAVSNKKLPFNGIFVNRDLDRLSHRSLSLPK